MEALLAKRDSNTSVVRGLIPLVAERENICMRTKQREAKEAAAAAELCVCACVCAWRMLICSSYTHRKVTVSVQSRHARQVQTRSSILA